MILAQIQDHLILVRGGFGGDIQFLDSFVIEFPIITFKTYHHRK